MEQPSRDSLKARFPFNQPKSSEFGSRAADPSTMSYKGCINWFLQQSLPSISCRDDESWWRESRKLREGSPITDRTERVHAVRRIRLPPVAWAVWYSTEACAVDSWQSGHRNYHDTTRP